MKNMKPEARAIYAANLLDFGHLADGELMGLTIDGEAEGEIIEGKVAVGTVILCRVEHRAWDGKNIREVCLLPKQFSCFNPGAATRPRLERYADDFPAAVAAHKALADCHAVAQGLLTGVIRKDMDLWDAKCCQYLTTEAKKHCQWWKKMRFVKKVGGHEFYSDL